MNHELTTSAAIKEAMPTVFGYIGIGIAFGVVAKAAGFSPLIVTLMSLIIYAGSAQFIAVSMLAAHSPILSIVFAVFLVNARMILISTTVSRYLPDQATWKNVVLGSFITDESFALSMNKINFTDHKLNFAWLNAANSVAYWVWALASLVGAVLGQFIANPDDFGLNFAIVAMFLGLLYLQIISDRVLGINLQLLVVAITLVLMYIGLIFIPVNILVLVVTLIACGLGVWLRRAFF
ncbi:AzlC family ABC transporter permease [Lentilactobacillus kribbianus]|uniref:AzlC family ABC transporter permease n=1 Tax=Lentilactobacillus kribbianus TaxID=2729622 RepID=UPI0015558E14|nr:AzlC family ABC transporter permease [Lentilactobacillus kribbianus]